IAALVIAIGNATGWRILPAGVELVAFNVCLLIVLAELGLEIVASLSGSPVFATEAASVRDRIESYRPEPGTLRFGFPVNSMGHYDTEFLPRADRNRVTVAMIGDSFSAGIVPHSHHFSTVCEEVDPRVEVYNFGVPAIAPQHYAYLLAHEVLPLEPDAVIVGIFVGNDFSDRDVVASGWWTHWFDRDRLLLCVVPQRLAVVLGERAGARPVGALQGETGVDPRAFEWLRDFRSEQPTFSRERYVSMERDRARALTALDEATVEDLVETIAGMRALTEPRPFGIVVIPDVFQVDDLLWSELGCDDRERDRAQRLLVERLSHSGIAVLDLLPVMREQPFEPDGLRHLYHLHDSHFNARGNAVAGRAIAAFVERLLAD
ncbi:MAG: hypothetical protein KDB80_15460, partial [Planctomycetes bacterium]|nr:hypothetical protein [Planctomycetota bacterium]